MSCVQWSRSDCKYTCTSCFWTLTETLTIAKTESVLNCDTRHISFGIVHVLLHIKDSTFQQKNEKLDRDVIQLWTTPIARWNIINCHPLLKKENLFSLKFKIANHNYFAHMFFLRLQYYYDCNCDWNYHCGHNYDCNYECNWNYDCQYDCDYDCNYDRNCDYIIIRTGSESWCSWGDQ